MWADPIISKITGLMPTLRLFSCLNVLLTSYPTHPTNYYSFVKKNNGCLIEKDYVFTRPKNLPLISGVNFVYYKGIAIV